MLILPRIFDEMASSRPFRFLPSLAFIAVYLLFVVDVGVDGALSRGSSTNGGINGGGTGTGYSSSSNSRGFSSSGLRGLDKVLNRLDTGGQQSRDHHPFSSSDSATLFNSKGRASYTSTTTSRPLPSSFLDKEYEDLEDDLDDDDTYEDEEETADGNHNDVFTSKWGYQYRNRYLAAKATTSTTTTTTTTTPRPPPTPAPISYSQYKWNTYGSRAGVEQSRRQSYHTNGGFNTGGVGGGGYHSGRHHGHHSHNNHNNNNGHQQYNQYGGSNSRTHAQPQTPDTAIKQAVDHALKVQTEGVCRVPRPKLIRVQEFYPQPGKTYLPHCTILHQCSDDTGCCKHDLTCSPKTSQRVELSFYTINIESNRGSTVERLVFYNHTECECRDKMDELMPRDFPYSESSSKLFLTNHLDPVGQSGSGNKYESSIKKRNLLRCKCPSAFTERILGDGGSCSCDCFDKQTDCLRQKRGRDFFSMQDKWCIQSGRCEVPGCSHGSYIHLAGRCPRKGEKSSSSWHRYLAE